MQQYGTFQETPRNLYFLVETAVWSEVKKEYRGFFRSSAEDIAAGIQDTLDCLTQATGLLTQVSDPHQFSSVIDKRMAQIIDWAWEQRLERILHKCKEDDASDAVEATSLIMAVQTICRTIDYVMNN